MICIRAEVFGLVSEEKGGKTYGSFCAEESEAAIADLFEQVTEDRNL